MGIGASLLFILVALVVLSGLFSGAARPLRTEETAPAVPITEG
ncbi:hypothetical protein [Microbacterium sp. NPDC077486]